MTAWLKQSTAVEIKLGPFVDQTDGFTAETALTMAQADVRLAKNGGDWAQKAETTTMVHEENGWYRCLLDTTDTNTLGILKVAINESGALPVWETFMVVAANVYDSLIGGGDTLDVQVTGIGADVITAASIAAGAIDAATFAAGAINAAAIAADAITAAKVADGTIDAATFAASAITAAALAADAGAEIADAVLDELLSGHTGAGSLGKAIADIEVDTSTTLQGELDGIQADTEDIQARLPAALVSGRIDASVGAMAAGVVTAAAVGTGAIDADAIAADAITAAKIATGAITNGKFAAGAIDGPAIAANAGEKILQAASGTADAGGSTTTIIDAERTEADTDYWKGSVVLMTSGPNIGLARRITAFNATTDTLTVSPAFPQAVATGNTYIILRNAFAEVLVDAIKADVITAAAIANGAIDAATFAAGAIDAAAIATGAIDADAIAADAIGSSELAASAVNEIADQVWDELLSGHVISGSAGLALAGAGSAGDPWTTALPGAYGAGTAGKILADAGVEATAIKAKTDSLVFTSGRVHSNPTMWAGAVILEVDADGYPKVTIKDGVGQGELAINAGVVDADAKKWNGVAVAAPDSPGHPKVTVKDGNGVGELHTTLGIAEANVKEWTGTAIPGVDTNGYPKVTIKNGAGSGEINTTAGVVQAEVVNLAAGGIADVEAAVESKLNSAIPGSPGADSVYARLDTTISSRASPADVDAELRDVLSTELLSDPAQAAPTSTPSMKEATALLYFYLRNKVENDGSFLSVYRDDGTTVAWKRPVSQVAGLFTRGEAITGP